MKASGFLSLALVAGLMVLQPGTSLKAQTATYDPTPDFSITNGNPNGAWSYGWMPVDFGTMTLFTNALTGVAGNLMWAGWNYDGTPGIWKNLGEFGYGVPTGWLSLHPGPGREPIVLRWTAPATCYARAAGEFLPGDGGVMQVAVRLNGQPWWSASDSGAFSLETTVGKGDTIDFTVYGGYGYGNTPFTVMISTGPSFLLDLVRHGETNHVSFTAPTNGTYILEFTEKLSPPISWTDLTTNTLSAEEIFTFTARRATQAGFYRARRE
jgi:hypothetical protein